MNTISNKNQLNLGTNPIRIIISFSETKEKTSLAFQVSKKITALALTNDDGKHTYGIIPLAILEEMQSIGYEGDETFFLDRISTVSKTELRSTIIREISSIQRTSKKSLPTLGILFSNNSELRNIHKKFEEGTFDSRTTAIDCATRGNLESIQALLASNTIEVSDINTIVKLLSSKRHIKCLIALIAAGNIGEWSRGWALQEAAEKGYIEDINALLANHSICQTYSDWAVKNSVTNGHLTCLKVILEKSSLSEQARVKSIEGAIVNGNVECLLELINSVPMREKAISLSTQYNRINCLKALSSNSSISEFARGEAIQIAAQRGFFDCLSFLLENTSICDEILRRALQIATDDRCQQLLKSRVDTCALQ